MLEIEWGQSYISSVLHHPSVPVRIRPDISALPPYRQGRVAPESGFKLSSNENPYPPLPSVVAVVAQSLEHLNRYPSAGGLDLRQELARRHNVGVGQVHIGSGSVALLAQLISAAAGPGDEVVYAWRSFEAYPGLVTVAGATSVQVPNLPDGSHDLDAMAAAITDVTRVIIVCTPNNPTGSVISESAFREFMKRVPPQCLVLLDEAYIEFVVNEDSVRGIPLLAEYPNLIVLRTFSKAYGLAGLRIGYAVGSEEILDAARATAIPLSVTDAARCAAIASLHADAELLQRVATLCDRRDRLRSALLEQGWSVPQSGGNFLWLATGDETDVAADAFFTEGLTVRAFSGDGIRVSVGEEESVAVVCTVAAQILSMLPPTHRARPLG